MTPENTIHITATKGNSTTKKRDISRILYLLIKHIDLDT